MRGDFLRPPHGTTPAAVATNKNKKSLDPLKAKNMFIRKAEDGPYLGFNYKSAIVLTRTQWELSVAMETRIDVYETLCPQQMLVHKGGKIKNWGGECRDVTPTKSLSQNIRVDVNREVKFL